MAGFGGLGASFPTRAGIAPTSTRVDTDGELKNDYKTWLDGMQAAQDNIKSQNTQTYLNEAAPLAYNNFVSTYGGTNAAVPGGLGLDPLFNQSTWTDAAANNGTADGFGLSNWFAPYVNSWTDANANTYAANQAEIEKRKADLDTNIQQRDINQTAQQQAYNGMLNQGQVNGVIGAGYTSPTFGQVTGQQAAAPIDTNNPLGLDQSFSTGTYSPTGVFTAKPIAKSTWGLG